MTADNRTVNRIRLNHVTLGAKQPVANWEAGACHGHLG